jgi:hypothetical protein
MRRTNKRVTLALAGLLTACSSGIYADEQSPVVGKLPKALRVATKRATPAVSEWGMIEDPLISIRHQTAITDNNAKNFDRDHWVQQAPKTELPEPTLETPRTQSADDKIIIVLPIENDERGPDESELSDPLERSIRSISLDIKAPAGSMPPNPAAMKYESNSLLSNFELRPWQEEVYFWESPIFCHRPLYFEEQRLERDGLARFPMIRPAISGAHFFASCAALPYQTVMHPPCVCVPSSQPSSLRLKHTPTVEQRQFKAAMTQTATVAGLILLIP